MAPTVPYLFFWTFFVQNGRFENVAFLDDLDKKNVQKNKNVQNYFGVAGARKIDRQRWKMVKNRKSRDKGKVKKIREGERVIEGRKEKKEALPPPMKFDYSDLKMVLSPGK